MEYFALSLFILLMIAAIGFMLVMISYSIMAVFGDLVLRAAKVREVRKGWQK